MPRKSNVVLKSQTRKMVFDVFSFMKRESKTECDAVKRTAEATSTSESTVRRIVKESKSPDFLTSFRTPGKKKAGKKSVTNIDSFDQMIVKRCIHNFHITNKELPTVEKLRRKLKDDISFKGSERSLRRIIEELGFQRKKAENNRKLFIEKSNIRCQRIEYLEKIIKYRQQGRPIVYSDESYVDSSNSSSKKISVSKAQRIVIVHAGSETGFVPNALLLFKTDMKSGDDQDYMNFEKYQKWLHNQLIPNLSPNSVLVLDNASYHNKQYGPAPKSTAKKTDLQKWLTERDIQYDKKMYNPQLYKLVKLNKEQYKKFIIDKILAEHGHTVLRLPPYHPDLNPIEMAWAAIKEYVSNKNISWNINNVIQLVKEKVEIMGASEWAKLCDKVKEIELEYIKSDRVVDLAIEQFIIYADEDSDSDSDDDIDDDEDSDEDIPVPCTSSGSTSDDLILQVSFIKSENDYDNEDRPVPCTSSGSTSDDRILPVSFIKYESDYDNDDEGRPVPCTRSGSTSDEQMLLVSRVKYENDYDDENRPVPGTSSGSTRDEQILPVSLIKYENDDDNENRPVPCTSSGSTSDDQMLPISLIKYESDYDDENASVPCTSSGSTSDNLVSFIKFEPDDYD